MSDPYKLDGQKLSLHPHRVAQLLDGRDNWDTAKYIFPLYVELSPIGACNHACLFCSVDMVLEAAKNAKEIPKLDHVILHDRLSEMGMLGIKSCMAAGSGEPLLHKHINEIVCSSVDAGIDIAFTSNGVLLNKLDVLNECTWVKISFNAGTRDSYAHIHRTKAEDFDRVLANLADAVLRKDKCTLGVQCVLLPENDKDIVTLTKICRDIGVDYLAVKPYTQAAYSINRRQVDYSHYQKLEEDLAALTNDKFDVIFRAESMKAVSTEIPYSTCRATPFLWCYIEADGSVYSCSAYLTDKRFIIGNINDNTFEEIWTGEGRRKNYEMMKTLDITQCRKSCRQNQTNIYLNELVEGIPHQNFI